MDLIKFLEKQNYWYNKFLKITVAFLKELEKNPSNAINKIFIFEENRKSLLNIINKKIDLKKNKINNFDQRNIDFLIKEREKILIKIISNDKEIFEIIEKIKNENEKKIKSIRLGRRAITGYKLEKKDISKFNLQL